MASIRKRPDRDRPWQVRWRDPAGRQKSKSFVRKVDATRFRTKVEHEVLTSGYVDPHDRTTLRQFAEQWLERQVFDAPTRIAVQGRLATHVYPHLGDLELRAIKPSTLQAWVRGQGIAPSYVQLILGHVAAILQAAVDDQLIAANPAASRSVRAPKVERRRVVPWTTEQVRAIIACHPRRYAAVPQTGAGTGMRQGELFGLAVNDIDFLGRTVHVRQQVRLLHGKPTFAPPKGGKEREIPLPETVAMALAESLRAFPAREVTLPWKTLDGDPARRRLVFTGERGAALNKNPFNERVWRPALQAAGIPWQPRRTGMHQLRHHYASVLLDASVSVAALASYLGHDDPAVTLRVYSHLMPNSEDKTRQAIDAAFSHGPDVAQGAH